MSKYYVRVEFTEKGFSEVTGLWGVVRLVRKYSRSANVIVSRVGMR